MYQIQCVLANEIPAPRAASSRWRVNRKEVRVRLRACCERFLAAVAARDARTVELMLAPDFTVTEAAGLPYGGTYQGSQGWRELMKAVFALWPDFKARPVEYFGEGDDTLVVRFAISGRNPDTDVAFESTVLEIWRFRGGQIVRIEPYYWDTHHLATLGK
jgi:ketosteroid isomerase-like protein